METEPRPERRWFQFSLRRLMIGVTLLAVAFGYVAGQARIVWERKAMKDWVRANGGYVPDSTVSAGLSRNIPQRWSGSWIRGSFGDCDAVYVVVPNGTSDEQFCRVKAVFPDAEVTRQ
jgi:hypothetical protein